MRSIARGNVHRVPIASDTEDIFGPFTSCFPSLRKVWQVDRNNDSGLSTKGLMESKS
jgi:hypothetical protein